ncbi:ABC transporter permease [Cryobacterium suzukii]|uniref:ABC transporter permease n=1 Tax=Cryobacterium suzukii TaxID=1259198 RepID=A0A4R9AK52_9MICO|nr:ABC transporter permease [Cryobacterium suzukii]TFD63196.1 ABC transporter permease [Cryobacterium suzukii]
MKHPGPRRASAQAAQAGPLLAPGMATNPPRLFAALRRARVALRIARRSTARSPGRSALIVTLVALPVAGMAAITLIIPSTVATTAERLAVTLGHTQAQIQLSMPGSGIQQDPFFLMSSASTGEETEPVELRALFPADTRMIPVFDTSVTAKTRSGVAVLDAVEGETWDPSLAGHYDVTAGQTPQNTNEVMASAAMLDRLGLSLGDEAELLAPEEKTVTVVGALDDRTQPSSRQTLFGFPGTFGGDTGAENNPEAKTYLPDTIVDWAQVQKLNEHGIVALSRDVFENPPPAGTYPAVSEGSALGTWLLVAGLIVGFGLLEVMLLAGAAFAVGARAQERSLATVASVGSNRSTIFSIIAANGIVLGALGGIVGVGIGIGAGSAFMLLTDDGSATMYFGYHLWWPAMIGVAIFAIIVGWGGAVVPAIRASKLDVIAALRGARRPSIPSKRRPVIGIIAVLVGISLTLLGGILNIVLAEQGFLEARDLLYWALFAMLLVGPIVAQLGLLLCSGLVLRLLARLLSKRGVAARLASRDAARNTGRSVPALAVIMTTVFAAVFAMTMMTSTETTNRANYDYSTMPGQVRLTLTYPDQETRLVTTFAEPDAFVAAARASVDVDTVRTLKGVADPRGPKSRDAQLSDTESAQLLPTLALPPANRCSAISAWDGPLTTQAARKAMKEMEADWRCQHPFVTSGISSNGSRDHIMVGDNADLALILDSEPTQAAKDALANGGAVSLYPEYLTDDKVTISWWTAASWEDSFYGTSRFGEGMGEAEKSVSINAVVNEAAHPINFGIFISEQTAQTLGLDYADSIVLASTTALPTDDQTDALNAAIDTLIQQPGRYWAEVERGPTTASNALSWGLLALCALIAVGAAAVAIGLARFDGRRDHATLAAIGSSPRVQRGFGFWQAVMIAGTGAVLGTAIGLIPPIALTLPGSGTSFAAPWLLIVTIAILLPLAIACGSWLFPGRKAAVYRAVIE